MCKPILDMIMQSVIVVYIIIIIKKNNNAFIFALISSKQVNYAHTFEKVGGAYCIWHVRPSVHQMDPGWVL